MENNKNNVVQGTIQKRDGQVVAFDVDMIAMAIGNASACVGEVIEDLDAVVEKVVKRLSSESELTVEMVQDSVVHVLMIGRYKKTAESYIKHRSERDVSREMKSKLKEDIGGLFDAKNTEVTLENANKNSVVIPTQRDLLAGIISKDYALKYLLPKNVAVAHNEGLIHYHDLDYSPMFGSYNCQLLGYKKMLDSGFTMASVEIEQPRSIRTACTVLTQIMAGAASESYGGLTANNIDLVMAPYVTKSYETHLQDAIEDAHRDPESYAKRKTIKEVYDSFQTVEYQINTLSTTNGQAPFSTLGFGLGTTWEEKLIQETILKVRLRGIGKKRKTPCFPKLCFVLKDGLNLNKEDPNYDMKLLAMECQRKRIYPDLLNYEKVVEITGSFKTPMGRR